MKYPNIQLFHCCEHSEYPLIRMVNDTEYGVKLTLVFGLTRSNSCIFFGSTRTTGLNKFIVTTLANKVIQPNLSLYSVSYYINAAYKSSHTYCLC